MEASKDAIAKDQYFQQQMKNSLKYYLYNIAQSNAMNGISSTTKIVYIRTWVDNAVLAAEIGTGVLAALCFLISLIKGRKKA